MLTVPEESNHKPESQGVCQSCHQQEEKGGLRCVWRQWQKGKINLVPYYIHRVQSVQKTSYMHLLSCLLSSPSSSCSRLWTKRKDWRKREEGLLHSWWCWRASLMDVRCLLSAIGNCQLFCVKVCSFETFPGRPRTQRYSLAWMKPSLGDLLPLPSLRSWHSVCPLPWSQPSWV